MDVRLVRNIPYIHLDLHICFSSQGRKLSWEYIFLQVKESMRKKRGECKTISAR